MAKRKKMRVGILCGGFSTEREVSLRSGENVMRHLSFSLYDVSKIDVVSSTKWWIAEGTDTGAVFDPETMEGQKYLKTFDVLVNVLHGAFGEDGRVQILLERAGVPYTGSGAKASSLAMDKIRAMEWAKKGGLLVPEYFVATSKDSSEDVARRIVDSFDYPVIVKPNSSGSTIGLSLVEEERELAQALTKAMSVSEHSIVQRYILGRECTGGVLGNTSVGGEGLLALPIVEIVIKNKIFDFNDKYFSKETQEICPAPFDDTLTEKMKKLCLAAHMLFGCDGLSRSDFRINGMGEVYFLEINTSPGMSESSLCPKEIRAQGMTMEQCLDRLIDLALARGVLQ